MALLISIRGALRAAIQPKIKESSKLCCGSFFWPLNFGAARAQLQATDKSLNVLYRSSPLSQTSARDRTAEHQHIGTSLTAAS